MCESWLMDGTNRSDRVNRLYSSRRAASWIDDRRFDEGREIFNFWWRLIKLAKAPAESRACRTTLFNTTFVPFENHILEHLLIFYTLLNGQPKHLTLLNLTSDSHIRHQKWMLTRRPGFLNIQAGLLALQRRWPRRSEIGAASDGKLTISLVHRGQRSGSFYQRASNTAFPRHVPLCAGPS
jgi:hypothetical protein